MFDMTYQQPNPVPRPYNQFPSRQYIYEDSEFLEEPGSFMDAVSYSESDGYIDVPMVHSVPSHDIQELYIRKPVMASGQLAAAQHSRCCFNAIYAVPSGYVYDLRPRPPPHLKMAHSNVSGPQPGSRKLSSGTSARPRAFQTSCHAKMQSVNASYTDSSSLTNTPATPVAMNSVPFPLEESAQIIDACGEIKRNTRRPISHEARRIDAPSSEPISRQSAPNPLSRPPRPQLPQGVSKSQEFKLPSDTKSGTFKCRTHPDVANDYVGVKKMNSEGDATGFGAPHLSSLDGIERIVATLDEDEVEGLSEEHRSEIKRMSKFLVPRVPTSVKALQNRSQQPSNVNVTVDGLNESSKLPEKTQSLNKILDQLENCELSLNAVRSKCKQDEQGTGKTDDDTEIKTKPEDAIFNLREISEKLSKSSYRVPLRTPNTDSTAQEICHTASCNQLDENSAGLVPRADCGLCLLDDTSALELHRSKSYIVNLIDRALSKELGTIPNERTERRNFQDLNPSKVVHCLNRNRRVENDICDGINDTTDHDIDCLNAMPELKDSQSSISNDGEPTYIKQLKELRWGHFKHIQQEVKRLEDLERFLDACGTPCGSTF